VSAHDARAVEAARVVTGAGTDVPARMDVVERLDRPDRYRLVTLGRPGESGWVVAVGEDGEVASWAELASGEPTIPSGDGDLVWWPSATTASALYPLRRVERDGTTTFTGLDGRPLPGPGSDTGRPRGG
jgi:hypothetical protein